MKRRLILIGIILVGTVIGMLYWRAPRAANVSPGPGSNGDDIFPCKVLTNFAPLLQPRRGLGVVGLQFLISREQDSILTTIWGANTKGAILVDWTNEKVVPASGMDNLAGIGLSPQDVPLGLSIFGGNGRLAFGGATFPWRKGFIADPLALREDESVWFGTVYQDEPRELKSLICLSPQPPQVLGEIRMPPSKTVVWCLYDTKQKVLLVAEHEWNWIAMIDFSKPNTVRAAKPTETPQTP
jgi:hypothetical protein